MQRWVYIQNWLWPRGSQAFFYKWQIPNLRWGWVFCERKWILSGTQVTSSSENISSNFLWGIFCDELWTIRRWWCMRELDAANLLPEPALEHVCGKQTPSAGKLFSRANLSYVPISLWKFKWDWSRSVHFWGTCEKRTTAQCQISFFSVGAVRNMILFGSRQCAADLFTQIPKKCKYPKSAQT